MKNVAHLIFAVLLIICVSCSVSSVKKEETVVRRLTPMMGWASWNNYRINITENIIKKQADAMVSNGMAAAGYQFINIDDGFFGGRDKLGNLFCHPSKFPSGMRSLSDYIHSKGLKAGMYSDAEASTCAVCPDFSGLASRTKSPCTNQNLPAAYACPTHGGHDIAAN